MSNPIDNPYEARDIAGITKRWPLSRFVAISFLILSAVPTFIMLYWLGQHFAELYDSPSMSYRPIIGVVGVGMSIVTTIVGFPVSYVIKRFTAGTDRELIDLFYAIAALPTLLGLFGPFVIAWLTQSSFGS